MKVLAGTDDEYDPTCDVTYDDVTQTFVCDICYHGMTSDTPTIASSAHNGAPA